MLVTGNTELLPSIPNIKHKHSCSYHRHCKGLTSHTSTQQVTTKLRILAEHTWRTTSIKKKLLRIANLTVITGKCKLSPRGRNLLLTVIWIRVNFFPEHYMVGWDEWKWATHLQPSAQFRYTGTKNYQHYTWNPNTVHWEHQLSRSMWLPVRECNSQTSCGYEIKRSTWTFNL
jgi:hypothetical protein